MISGNLFLYLCTKNNFGHMPVKSYKDIQKLVKIGHSKTMTVNKWLNGPNIKHGMVKHIGPGDAYTN